MHVVVEVIVRKEKKKESVHTLRGQLVNWTFHIPFIPKKCELERFTPSFYLLFIASFN